jgi:hypothetical protein
VAWTQREGSLRGEAFVPEAIATVILRYKSREIDSERLCRAGHVALDLVEHAAHALALGHLEPHPGLKAGSVTARTVHLLGQVVTVNDSRSRIIQLKQIADVV